MKLHPACDSIKRQHGNRRKGMEFSVGVGKSDFAEIRSKKNYYVDKTEMVFELVGKPENNVTLFTRPRNSTSLS